MKNSLPIGCYVRIEKPELQVLIDSLKELHFEVIGPTISQDAVTFAPIDSIKQMPVGYVDEQESGRYRLQQNENGNYFDFVVGPLSMKNYLFPSRTTILETLNIKGDWQIRVPEPDAPKYAFLGVRSCDLHALVIQDRIFLEGPYTDNDYQARRQRIFLIAVNCGCSAPTCFCASMGTGPAVSSPADLVVTELDNHFVLEVGSERGGLLLADVTWYPCTTAEIAEAQQVPKRAENQQTRTLDTKTVHETLMNNLEHPRWEEVAKRCLSCTNCTMVCPTCFCSTVQEVTDLAGDQVCRQRQWDSCFTDDHSYMNSGTVRKSTRSRYRQWLTHKLATWIDQFGTFGCVGCGRCITWCPVGIDLTEEVAAMKGGPA